VRSLLTPPSRRDEGLRDPDVFEPWLLDRCLSRSHDAPIGALRAMARDIVAEWRLAAISADFRAWLAAGAPSDDRGEPAMPLSPLVGGSFGGELEFDSACS